MEKKRNSFWVVLLGATAALAIVAVGAVVLLGGDDDKNSSPASATAGAKGKEGLPEFALNFPETWKRVAADAPKGQPPRAVIQRKDGSGIITMTINGPVKKSLAELRGEMRSALRAK